MEMKWGQYHKWVGRPGHRPNKTEEKIMSKLKALGIFYRCEWSNSKCCNKEGHRLFFDFAIYKNEGDLTPCCLIEYQGDHHYREVSSLPGAYEKAQEHDKIKKQFCIENNIPLIELGYADMLNDFDGILSQIKSKYIDGTKFFEFGE